MIRLHFDLPMVSCLFGVAEIEVLLSQRGRRSLGRISSPMDFSFCFSYPEPLWVEWHTHRAVLQAFWFIHKKADWGVEAILPRHIQLEGGIWGETRRNGLGGWFFSCCWSPCWWAWLPLITEINWLVKPAKFWMQKWPCLIPLQWWWLGFVFLFNNVQDYLRWVAAQSGFCRLISGRSFSYMPWETWFKKKNRRVRKTPGWSLLTSELHKKQVVLFQSLYKFKQSRPAF